MESPVFYAKSKPLETLDEHTDKVCERLEAILSLYGDRFSENEKRLGRLACRYHDFGKVERIFQEIVRGKRRPVELPHGFLSGMFLWKDAQDDPSLLAGFSEEEIRALYTAIHYHHVREDDWNEPQYREYCEENLRENYEALTNRPYQQDQFRYLRKLLFRNSGSWTLRDPQNWEEAYRAYVLTVGLLNRADYAASGDFDIELERKSSLSKRVTDRFAGSLKDAQQFMLDNRGRNVIVVAPTGSGKTEGALLWSGDDKLFYTLPMKVSANGIYRRIHDAKEQGGAYGFEQTALLHSDAVGEYLKSDAGDGYDSWRRFERQYRAARGLAYPVTVSTVDQLFKFAFRALGTELFAATLKYSNVVVDEMQAYEPRILAMLVWGLKFVSEMGGRYAIITATLPGFIKRALGAEGTDYAYGVFSSDLERHVARLMPDEYSNNDFDIELIREQASRGRVLVVCNTVGNAQNLKKQLPEARLLHSRFIKKDRDRLEKEIVEFQSDPSNRGIWISTQLVEASLDIDFDYLHTEMCSADSLLQRMGRCWRSRQYLGKGPNVFIYDHGACGVYDETLYARSKRFLQQYLERIFTEREKLEYVDFVFDDSEDEFKNSKYFKEFQDWSRKVRDFRPTAYTKQEADKHFRDIYSYEIIPDSVYKQYQGEIERCLAVINTNADSESTREDALRKRFEAREALKQFTLHVDRFGLDGDRSPFMDKKSTLPGTEIHRTRANYSEPFPADGRFKPDGGLGLLREERPDDSFL